MHTWSTEAELAQALQVLGFSYASYRLAVGVKKLVGLMFQKIIHKLGNTGKRILILKEQKFIKEMV
ncbi:hypothetical protein ACWOFR_14660 [Carnobacterium gallinarum]|uniref:hypothetical protein n=1 Tax=Carnobacterium gallinarum TaxID=2749 RepID=UPI000555B49B|nr:hypothetical protein [Carnobacterium gallinarum]